MIENGDIKNVKRYDDIISDIPTIISSSVTEFLMVDCVGVNGNEIYSNKTLCGR